MTGDPIRASRMWVTPLDDTGVPTGPRREVTGLHGFTIDHRPFPDVDHGPIDLGARHVSFDLDLSTVIGAWQRLTEAFVDVIAAVTRFAGAAATRYAIEQLGVTEADIRRATLTGVTLWNGRRIPIDTHQVLAWARGKDHHA